MQRAREASFRPPQYSTVIAAKTDEEIRRVIAGQREYLEESVTFAAPVCHCLAHPMLARHSE
jgi:hypothetical protein